MRRTVVASVLVALTATLWPAQAHGEAHPRPSNTTALKAITHNVAGGMIGMGDESSLVPLIDHIGKFQPHVVMLQEVCVSQFEILEKRYPNWNWEWSETRFSEPGCDGDPSTIDPHKGADTPGDELGIVLGSPYSLTNVTRTVYPHANWSRVWSLLCADLNRAVRACSTHLMSGGFDAKLPVQARRDQVRVAMRTLRPYLRKRIPVVWGGDFNTRPRERILNPVYKRFNEADQGVNKRGKQVRKGAGTIQLRDGRKGSKIDHIFFDKARTVGPRHVSALTVCTNHSDHCLLRAKAIYR